MWQAVQAFIMGVGQGVWGLWAKYRDRKRERAASEVLIKSQLRVLKSRILKQVPKPCHKAVNNEFAYFEKKGPLKELLQHVQTVMEDE